MCKVYVASSWKNLIQPAAIATLRQAGFEVYDFRNPPGSAHEFSWARIDSSWSSWTRDDYVSGLNHAHATTSFARDHAAMTWADACLLVLPAGASAHLEAGYFAGHPDKRLVILLSPAQPDSMLTAGLTALGHTVDHRSCRVCDAPDGCRLSTPKARAEAQRTDDFEPELMHKLADEVVTTLDGAVASLRNVRA